MKLIGLISGGKDSIYNLFQCIAAGHDIIAVGNIEPEQKDELDSYMYQSVGHQVVSLIATALGLPIFRHKTKGTALCKSKIYKQTEEDEVEDLYMLLRRAKRDIQIEGVAVGAIASDYQRNRVESVCQRLDLVCFAYLWKRNQAELLSEMIEAKIDAVIIKVAGIGLNPDVHLGMNLSQVYDHLLELNSKFGSHICGEGGEYESLTLDCPLFERSIKLIDSEVVVLSNDAFAPVAFLNVKNATLLEKNDQSLQSRLDYIRSNIKTPINFVEDCIEKPIIAKRKNKSFSVEVKGEAFSSNSDLRKKSSDYQLSDSPYHLNSSKKWECFANIHGRDIQEAIANLKRAMDKAKFDVKDLVLVNLFIKDTDDYSIVNRVYSEFVNNVNPPARVCVATEMISDVGSIILAVAHKNSENNSKVPSDRETIHVQSISHWAPANIGPYSQCVKIDYIYYLAGQIPLIPGTMEILNKPPVEQAKLTLCHIQRLLQEMRDILTFENIIMATCYVTNPDIVLAMHKTWLAVTNNTNSCLTIVCVNSLPKNAPFEWEIVASLFEHPKVEEARDQTDDYTLVMKRCYFQDPLLLSFHCIAKFAKSSGNLKLFSPCAVSSIIETLLNFLRKNLQNMGPTLCYIKVFFKSNSPSIYSAVVEALKNVTDVKVIPTAVPLPGSRNDETCLTITGICHDH